MKLIFYKEEDTFLMLTETHLSPDAEMLPITLQMKTSELLNSSVFRKKRRKVPIQIPANSGLVLLLLRYIFYSSSLRTK